MGVVLGNSGERGEKNDENHQKIKLGKFIPHAGDMIYMTHVSYINILYLLEKTCPW